MAEKSRSPLRKLMRFVGRFALDIIGWGLMAYGLSVLRGSLQFLNYSAVIEGGVAALIGLICFRGGLQLVKISVAARAFRSDPLALQDASQREYPTA